LACLWRRGCVAFPLHPMVAMGPGFCGRRPEVGVRGRENLGGMRLFVWEKFGAMDEESNSLTKDKISRRKTPAYLFLA